MAGALGHTLSAGGTLGIVDSGQIVHHMDGVVLTGLFTDLAADTAHVAILPQRGALLLRVAGHRHLGGIGHFDDQILGAGLGALHTPYTEFMIHVGHAVLDGHGPKGAGLDAGTKPRQP